MFPITVRAPDNRRFLDALLREPGREVPWFEAEFSPGMAGHILGRRVEVRSYELPPADYVELLRRTGIDTAYLHVAWRPGRLETVGQDGRRHYRAGTIRTRDELRRITPPDVDRVRQRIEAFLRASEGTRLGWMHALNSTSVVPSAMGYEDYYLTLHDDPSFIEEFLDRVESFTLPLTELVLGYRPDAVLLSANVCGKSGLAISPDHAERFVLSRLRNQMELIRRAGVPAIIHSDGDNRDLMDQWIEMGFAGYHPVEPGGRYDIYGIKHRWGDRIALLGNIDVSGMLGKGTPAEVAEDTLRHLEGLSPGGGYICGSSHDIDDNIPIANLHAMMETIHAWRSGCPGPE